MTTILLLSTVLAAIASVAQLSHSLVQLTLTYLALRDNIPTERADHPPGTQSVIATAGSPPPAQPRTTSTGTPSHHPGITENVAH